MRIAAEEPTARPTARPPRGHPLLIWSRIKATWPTLIWLGAVASAIYLYGRGTEFAALTGRVETRDEQISPIETERVLSIPVSIGDHVTNGQIVATLDASTILAEIALNEALILETTEAMNPSQDAILEMFYRARSAVSDADTALSGEKKSFAEAKAELKVLDSEIARLQTLVDQRMIDISAVSLLKARQAVLRQSVDLFPAYILEIEKRLQIARENFAAMRQWLRLEADDEDGSKAVKEKIAAQQNVLRRQIDILQTRLEKYSLRATRDGTVSKILAEPGYVVAAGTPIVVIVEPMTTLVTAFLPENTAAELRPGMPAWVVRRSAFSSRYRAELRTLSPEIEVVPIWFSPAALRQQMRGRRVIFELAEEHVLLPGEVVDVSVESHGASFGAQIKRMRYDLRRFFGIEKNADNGTTR